MWTVSGKYVSPMKVPISLEKGHQEFLTGEMEIGWKNFRIHKCYNLFGPPNPGPSLRQFDSVLL